MKVADQGWFASLDRSHWARDVQEAVLRKLRLYGGKAPCQHCWLLINLRPYLMADEDARAFLDAQAPLCPVQAASGVFERVYALVGDISNVGGPAISPLRRLL